MMFHRMTGVASDQFPADNRSGISRTDGAASDASTPVTGRIEVRGGDVLRRWSVDAGVAVISAMSTLDVFRGRVDDADGDAGGRVYNLSVSRLLKRWDWRIGGSTLHPQLELPLTLGIVDENSRSPFLSYSTGLMFRWTDFPWNRYVHTTAGIGSGLYYAHKIPTIDVERHPGSDRSHFKFYLVNEFTFAHPRHQRYQLVLFNHHFSGGHIFDKGGFDTFGAALRCWF